jgi:hypothetical protein
MNGGGPLRAALALALVACGMAAPPAGAAPTELAGGRGLGAPRLAGDSVVAFTPSAKRVVRVRADGSRTVIRDIDRPARPYRRFEPEFRATASHVAVGRFVEVHTPKGAEIAESSFRLEAGPLDGPLRELFDCHGDHAFDVDGTRIAYTADACTDGPGGSGRIVVRDLALEGAPVVHSIRAGALSTLFPLDLAGDHVAHMIYGDGPDLRLVARDLSTGDEIYRTAGSGNYSLQPDGKLAAARPKDCLVDWFSRAEPFAHEIDLCPGSEMRVRNDRIALVGGRRDGATLMTVSLGGERREIAVFEPSGAFGGFDYDGTRVAYGLRGCVPANSPAVRRRPDGRPAPRAARPLPGVHRVAARPRVLGRPGQRAARLPARVPGRPEPARRR